MATVIKPRVYVKKMPNLEVKNSFVNMVKIGKMLEGDMGRAGLSITGLVLTAMNHQIEDRRIRKSPIGKHDLSLEPWRLTAGRNLIAVLRESTEIRKEAIGNNFRYTFVLGQKTFLDKHTGGRGSGSGRKVGYWAMLNYGGKISIDATGVPGYFGSGTQPSSRNNNQSFHWSPGFGKSPTGTRIGLMIPKKLIVGINYIYAGYLQYLKYGQSSIMEMKYAAEEAFISKQVGTHPTVDKVRTYERKMKAIQNKKDKLIDKDTEKVMKQKAAILGLSLEDYQFRFP